jgi:phosphohistidine phosphatase SixA
LGVTAGKALGKKLIQDGYIFKHILCSPETKAIETAEAVREGYGKNIPIEISPNLSEHKRTSFGFLSRKEFEESIAEVFVSDNDTLVSGDETANEGSPNTSPFAISA